MDINFSVLFQSAASALDVGMVLVDMRRQVFFVNAQAAAMLGSEPQELVGYGLIALVRDHQADEMVQEVLADGEPRETTLKPITADRTFRLRCTQLRDGDTTIGALLLIRDITQLSMLERSRRDLVANVSHELRTPLASLKLLVETVQSGPPPDVTARMLEQMSQEVDAVTQLVDELHELAQIEAGRVTLKFAPLPITPTIDRAIERIRPQADRKSLNIDALIEDGHAQVLMDSDRVGQILLNLLHNAVKFTAAQGRVTVRTQVVSVAEVPETVTQAVLTRAAGAVLSARELRLPDDHLAGMWMLISVSDTGIGIPAQDLPRIFERFYKVDRSRNRNAGGTGLGLAIAKHLVEGHGGRLWARSVEGRGSTFNFTLPVV
jgi:two-component system phosphate regulon sensor histidine kinase PhoR